MSASLQLIFVFMSLGNRSYVKAMLFQFLMYGYWKSTNHPALKIVTENPQKILEEDGEISLSLLSHAASFHSRQYDIASMSKTYRLINYYRGTVAETLLDCKIRVGPKKQSLVHNTDPEVAITVRHFQRIIRQLSNGTWLHYPSLETQKGMFKTKNKMTTLLHGSIFFSEEKDFKLW